MRIWLLGVLLIACFSALACGKQRALKQLEGTTWSVTKIIYDGENETLPAVTVLLTFGEDGAVTLVKDVNTCIAQFEIASRSEISFATFACTEACCDDPFADEVVSILQTADDFDLDGNELYIANGKQIWLNKSESKKLDN